MYLPQIHHIQNVFDLFKGTNSSSASQFVSNDHLKQMDDDVLFHIGIRVGDLDIKKVFGDVKVKVFFSLRGTIFLINNNNFNNKSEKNNNNILCLPSAVLIALMLVTGRAKQIPETNTLNET